MTSETFGPWGKKWQYSFDFAGNRIRAIDPEGKLFKYAVDKLNRVVELDPPDRGDEVTYSFDAAGRPIGETRPGVKTTNTFDAAGRLLEMKHERDHGREKIVASRKYIYSAVGNRLTMIDEEGAITSYSYNGSDWLARVQYPDGKQVSYGYNGAGDRIEERTETPTIKGHGRNQVIGTDTVVIPMAYDAGGRLVSRASDTFQFDNDGNQVTAVENGDESRFFWSPDNRLVKVEKDIECPKHGKKRCHQCPQTVTLSESYTYEPESWRRLTRKTNDAELISVYDGNDESGEYLVKDTGHHFGWKCDKHKFFCKCPAPKPGKKLELIRQFIGGPGTDDLELTRYHGRKLWTLKDGISSTIALTNRGGHAVARIGYDAFGNFRWPDKPGHGVKPCRDDELDGLLDRLDGGRTFEFSHDGHHHGRHFSSLLNPFTFQARRWDSFSQTFNHRNRQYKPKYGRWLSRDPLSFSGGLNLWSFARNNPVILSDPLGLFWLSDPTLTANPIWLKAYQRIRTIISNQSSNPIFADLGWSCESDIDADFKYDVNRGPEIRFDDLLFGGSSSNNPVGPSAPEPILGYHTPNSPVIHVAKELLALNNFLIDRGGVNTFITEAELVEKLSNTIMHEISHWKVNNDPSKSQGDKFILPLNNGQILKMRPINQNIFQLYYSNQGNND
jgi:RHS repeat-associated protein